MDKLKKASLITTIIIMLFSSCMALTSCGDDEKDEPANSSTTQGLIGTWQNQYYIYHFDSNGKGYFQYSPTNGAYNAVGNTKSNFVWNASSNILSLTFDGSGTTSACTQTYYYEVDGNLLVLMNINSGDTNSYTRK